MNCKSRQRPCLFDAPGNGGEKTDSRILTFIKQPTQGMFNMAIVKGSKQTMPVTAEAKLTVDACCSYPSTSFTRLRALLEVGDSASFCLRAVRFACKE